MSRKNPPPAAELEKAYENVNILRHVIRCQMEDVYLRKMSEEWPVNHPYGDCFGFPFMCQKVTFEEDLVGPHGSEPSGVGLVPVFGCPSLKKRHEEALIHLRKAVRKARSKGGSIPGKGYASQLTGC